MPKLLEEPQLSQGDRVAQVDADPGGIDAVLDAERKVVRQAARELRVQLLLGNNLLDAAANERELVLDLFLDFAARRRSFG